PVFTLELHQVQRSQIAGGVVEKDVFRTGIGRVNRLGAFAGVPFLNGAIVLHAWIATNPSAFGNLVQQCVGIFFMQRFAGRDRTGPPFASVKRGLHEFVAGPNGEVLVLIHDAAVSIAIVRTVIALFNERPGLLFFLLLGIDEFFDVAMPIAQRIHLCGATGFAAGFDDVGDLIVNLEKRHGAAGASSAAEFFFAGANGTQISASARAVFEEHRLAVSQAHDVFHVVLDGLNEAGAAL